MSLLQTEGKEPGMDVQAKITAKGQVTLPKSVRDALGVMEGDTILFRVEGDRAVIAKTADFLALAGTIAVPAAARNLAWDEVLRRTYAARGERLR